MTVCKARKVDKLLLGSRVAPVAGSMRRRLASICAEGKQLPKDPGSGRGPAATGVGPRNRVHHGMSLKGGHSGKRLRCQQMPL